MARGGSPLSNLIYTIPALRDISSAARYLVTQTKEEKYGDELVAALKEACVLIAENPLIGQEHHSYALRSFPVRRYRIFYRVHEDAVEIIRVLHQRRNLDKPLRRWRRPRA